MTLTVAVCEKLVTPKPGSLVHRLPKKSAKTNAALIASIMKAKEGRE